MIRTILMDVDNTLLDFNKCASASMAEGFRDFGLEYRPEMFPIFLDINDRLWREIEQDQLTRDGLHRIRWPWIFDKLGIEADGIAFERRFCELLFDSHEPVEGAMELLRYLSGKYDVYVASNSSYAQQFNRLTLAGMMPFLKGLFVSHELGAPKPSQAFFDICMERLGNPPKEEVMLIGDSLTADMQGGVDYGLPTCWYNHNHQPRNIGLPVDHIVEHLWEIQNIL